MENITRRNLVQGAALGTVAVAAAAALAPTAAHAKADPSYAGTVDVPSFLIKPEPISDIAETKDFDVVVVGAGAAGVTATLAAVEAGAKVACLQKESTAISQGNAGCGVDLENSDPAAIEAMISFEMKENASQGNAGCGVDLDNSDPAAIEAMISFEMKENAYRPDRRQLAAWAYNSGETMRWLIDRAAEANAQCTDSAPTMEFGGGTVAFIKNSFGPTPYTTGNAMQDLAALAEQKGAEFFYETPGVQLVQDEAGRVTGVIGQTADGTYVQFNAAKGVIIATGNNHNDYDMCPYYLPDMHIFERKQYGPTCTSSSASSTASASATRPPRPCRSCATTCAAPRTAVGTPRSSTTTTWPQPRAGRARPSTRRPQNSPASTPWATAPATSTAASTTRWPSAAFRSAAATTRAAW